MTVLPSQKLSIGELCVSIAAGLMLFLLPNDARNQFTSESACISFVFIISIVIAVCLYLILKRYEAIGAALLTMSILELTAFLIGIIGGIASKGAAYWPKLAEYTIICMFIMWLIPFGLALFVRLLQNVSYDSNDRRRSFVRFLNLSMKGLLLIYSMTLLFKLLLPVRPHTETERALELIPFSRIGECLSGQHENGIVYLLWHILILAPLLFYLSVLIPRLRIWHSIVIGLSAGIFVEGIQVVFNTSTASVDDLMLYLIGSIIGCLFCRVNNKLREVLSSGQDKNMLSFDYTTN